MAIRIRENGEILCAAMHPKEQGDIYLDDQKHYELAVNQDILWTDKDHLIHGYWWLKKDYDLEFLKLF